MKILIASDFYTPQINGVVISTTILIGELNKLGHEVRVLTLSNNKKSIIQGNVYYNRSVSFTLYPDLRVYHKLDERIKESILNWKPDVIHTQSEFAVFQFSSQIAKILNIPLIHTYHTLYQYYTRYVFLGKKVGSYAVKKYITFTLNKANFVVAPTEKVRECLNDYRIIPEIKVIPTGTVGNLPEKIGENRKNELKEKYGIDTDKKIMLTVGRLGKEKNISEIISYMGDLLAMKSDIQLAIIGDGVYRNQLEALVKKNKLEKSILFTGMIPHDELDEIYQLGDLYVNASISETQGLTILEAMSNGLPIVCREDKSYHNMLRPNQNGLFYQNKSTFIQSTSKILNDDIFRTKLSKESSIIMMDYTQASFAKKIEMLYKQSFIRMVK